jgi:hypothetical protein
MSERDDDVHLGHALPEGSWGNLRSWTLAGGFNPHRADESDEGTGILPALESKDPLRVEALHRYDRARAGNTAIAVQRLSHAGKLEPSDAPGSPYGFYSGWQVIGSGSRIDGGIYFGRKPREAIVVDMRRPGSALLQVYETWLAALVRGRDAGEVRRELSENLALYVAELVAMYMPYDEVAVHGLERQGVLQPDQPVDLDLFLRAKGGVCRHQVCFVGAILERLAQQGWLHGSVSLERKFVAGWFSHAWVRFASRDGRIWVLDPAQRRYQTLDALDDGSRLLYGDTQAAATV